MGRAVCCAGSRKGGSGQHLVRVSETMSNSSKFAFSYRCIDFRKKRTFLRKPHFWLILALWLPFCEKGGYWRFWDFWRVLAMTPPLELKSGDSGDFWPIRRFWRVPPVQTSKSGHFVVAGGLFFGLFGPIFWAVLGVKFGTILLNFWSETRNFVKIALFALFGTPPKKVKKRSKKVQKWPPQKRGPYRPLLN